ncbi:hypothetical protein [Enterovirga sp. CN4-39]|uniref:hypothetical protein n=1 Tax=Enterovirga sp. CN4-39 TaxID=3400910 RepID=UPI003C01E276
MRATTLVLWLMIFLVFVPIAVAHGVAVLIGDGVENAEVASVVGRTGRQEILTH